MTDTKSTLRASAEDMGAKQRDISVSEFFTKNRHLLGFDNAAKALLTTVKEAVDNALDACEEAGILPTLTVTITEVAEGRYRVCVEDQGPGIVKEQIPNIFAKLLYGSKFFTKIQQRGAQGIGISAAGMYGQLTTGKPVTVISRIAKGDAWRMEVRINSKTNNSEIVSERVIEWKHEHGTSVEIELTASYRGGKAGVDAYLEQTVVANPHLELTFNSPKVGTVHYPRAASELPPEPVEIKPHPHGVEFGTLIKILQEASGVTVRQALISEFSRVTAPIATEICAKAYVDPKTPTSALSHAHIESIHTVMVASNAALPPENKFAKRIVKSDRNLRDEIMEEGTGFTPTILAGVLAKAGLEPTYKGKNVKPEMVRKLYQGLDDYQVKIQPPPATCVVPIGEKLILEGLKRRFKADYYGSHTRPAAVYRGNPFVVEVGIAFGGDLPKEEASEILRFANRVPLLYQARACGVTEAVLRVDWKPYGLQQHKGELPIGPMVIFLHLASVWVPYTSEAKEAVAHYEEIIREIRMALMECGRQLGSWVKAQESARWEAERKSLFEKYIHELSESIHSITGMDQQTVATRFHLALPNHVKIAAPKPEPEVAVAEPEVVQEPITMEEE